MLTYILLSFVIYLSVRFLYNSTRKPNNFPPGPKWYPILGSFPQLKKLMNSSNDLANAFEALLKQYKSKIVGLKLGSQNAVIVSSYKLCRDIFLDDNYLERPNTFFNRHRTLAKDKIMGITFSNGKLWSTQRTFVAKYFQNAGYRKLAIEAKVMNEIKEAIKIIDLNPIDIDFRKLFCLSVVNVLWTMVAGCEISRYDVRVNNLLNLMYKRTLAFDIAGGALNYFPWIRFFAPETLRYNLLKEINFELENFLNDTIEKHTRTWTEGKTDDLIYAFISEINRNDGTDSYFTYDQLKIVCLDLFIAGTTITSATIDFSIFAMATHQNVQTKVQKMLDKTFDKRQPLQYSDRKKVPYVEAVICEIERCYTPTPVLAARSPREDTLLGGYEIPQGTSIFMCFDSIYKNPEYFDQPEVFKPERFLDSNGNLTSHEAFFPFGLGKRKCLGDVLAKMSVFMVFAEIVRNYKIYPLDEAVIEQEKFIPGIFRSKQKYPIKLVKRF